MNLPTILWLISGLGLALTALLAAKVWEVNASIGVKRHRSRDAGLADLLVYGAVVDEGVILGKNGSFLVAWEYEGIDVASASNDQRNATSFFINRSINRLGNGWMAHVDVVRKAVPSYPDKNRSHFPDCISEAIDEERRRHFESRGNVYDCRFVLTLTHLPPSASVQKFTEWMYDDARKLDSQEALTQDAIEKFKAEAQRIENDLSSVLKLRRLTHSKEVQENGSFLTFDDFLSHLQGCITGEWHRVLRPDEPVFLDCLLGGQDVLRGTIAKVGQKFLQCVSIEGFPAYSSPGILTELTELSMEYRWSSRFIFLDSWEALSMLEKFRKKWTQRIVPFFSMVFQVPTNNVDEDADNMAKEISQSKEAVSSGKASAGYYTSVVVLMHEDRRTVENAAIRAKQAIQRLGFVARIETLNTVDAFFGSLPGHGVENVRRPPR